MNLEYGWSFIKPDRWQYICNIRCFKMQWDDNTYILVVLTSSDFCFNLIWIL